MRRQPAIGDTPNYHLGLAYVDRRRKLAFETVKMLVGLMGTQSPWWTTSCDGSEGRTTLTRTSSRGSTAIAC